MDNKQEHNSTPGEVVIDYRSFLTWIVTAVVAYSLLSGLMVTFLPFGVYAQFSIIIHTVVGLVAVIPLVAAVYLHWQRRKSDAPVPIARAAIVAVVALFVCVLTGLIITAMAVFGTWVPGWVDTVHLVSALVLGTLIAIHLAPIVARYGNAEASPRRAPRKRFVGTGVAIIAVLFAVTGFLSRAQTGPDQFQAFSDDYNWPHGDDRAFWPSRIAIANTPWLNRFLADVEKVVGAERAEDFGETLRGPQDAGLRAQTAEIVAALELDPDAASAVDDLVERAIVEQKQSGSLKPSALAGSATCGSSGCHQSIYKEWRASAHGFAAEDILFLQVQDLLIKEKGAAESRACAGCHDPAALLGGTRHEGLPQGSELPIFEANSCITCHSTIETDTNGNGGYVIQAPDRYLFEERDAGLAGLAAKFLIRAYPEKHVAEYKRPLYKTSEFCAACHKQVPPPGEATTAGLAQEQNEYDSWRSGRFYHGKDHPDTIECLECHMPLVDSDDPARGDDVDSYRSPNDGKHRSHRVLASNMYIPATMDIPGGDEQAELTIKWLRGEI
ncbi:MAG: multiheme c-type cytochrome, partial [Gammaproteobacteria bacterium]|nr:multiheme c-type cytochrome [Gammaproteobacteria bacterium]